MRRFRKGTGAALFTLLAITLIIVFLGVSVVSLVTLQARESLQRSNNIVSRQTALAGIKLYQDKISEDWDSVADGAVFREQYYADNKCYYDLYVSKPNPDKCILTATGYFKDSSFGHAKLYMKGVKAIFQKPKYNCAVFSIGDPVLNASYQQIPDAFYTDSKYYSLVINDTEIEGDIGTKQKIGKVVVRPKPVYEEVTIDNGGGRKGGDSGGGDTGGSDPGGDDKGGGGSKGIKYTKEKDVNLVLEPGSGLTIDKGSCDYVKEEKSEGNLDYPLHYGVQPFPEFDGSTPLDPSNPEPGIYSYLSVSGGSVELKGKGRYYIKDLQVSGGRLNLNGGEYYIENLDVKGHVELTAGRYYVKNLTFSGANITVNSMNLRPATIFVSNSIDIKNSSLNNTPTRREKDDEEIPPNPKQLIIYGAGSCQRNELRSSMGNFVLQNLTNTVSAANCIIEGSLIGQKVELQGGKCSLHTEITGEGIVQLISWEEM